MTNHEKYKQAFSCVKPRDGFLRDGFLTEVTQMENKKKHFHLNKIAAMAAAFALVVGSAHVAYAHNVGNIQRILQLWIHGDQTQVTMEFDGSGNYDMEYTDADGNVHQQGGGGVAFDSDGTERPLTEEELLEVPALPKVVLDSTAVSCYSEHRFYRHRIEELRTHETNLSGRG